MQMHKKYIYEQEIHLSTRNIQMHEKYIYAQEIHHAQQIFKCIKKYINLSSQEGVPNLAKYLIETY